MSTESAGVVVTGAAQGLGKRIAQRFSDEGYAVVGVDLAADKLIEAAAVWGPHHHAVTGDVGDPAVMSTACQKAAEAGRLATLVLNAGVTAPGASESFPLTEWDRVVNVNLRAAFVGARAAKPFLSAGSSVVIVSSICASRGFPERAAYCASKSGVDGLVRGLAVEWASEDIRVNAVAPGTFMTEMSRSLVSQGLIKIERFVERVPMRRQGRDEELAEAILFLGSARASYITGVVLPVDGGWSISGLMPQ
jgi:NAD(P)-dependent dehydrogenase (short-subunit alcohol dehydrogenase family)